MRYGIVSDIHSNLEALEAVLEALTPADRLICPGDIVGYGPDPNACCEILRERGITAVLGNHDAVVTGRASLKWFNPVAAEAAVWTREQLTRDNADFLRKLPLIHRDELFVLVHGTLSSPEHFDYMTSPWEARPTFSEMEPYDLCLIGHTHIAEFYFRKSEEIWADQIGMPAGGTIDLKPGSAYIVNCGSVGQPRDFNPRAAAGVLDTESRTIEILRVDYPIEITQRKMLGAGLPESLSRRLDYGT